MLPMRGADFAKAMSKEIGTSVSNSSDQAIFNGLLTEIKAFEKSKARHRNLEKLYQEHYKILPPHQ